MPSFLEWTGATSDLEEVANQLDDISSGRFMAKLVEEISKEAIRLIKKEFETSTDPYGNPWAPLKNPGKGPRTGGPLRKTDSMMKSIKRQLTRDGFKLVSDSPYIQFHQNGARSPRAGRVNSRRNEKGRWVKQVGQLPARIIFPLEGTTWKDAGDEGFRVLIETAIGNALKKLNFAGKMLGNEESDFASEGGVDIADFSGGGFSFGKGT